MNVNHYIGFDVHKKSISYCVKLADGTIVEEGKLPAKAATLREWAGKRSTAWSGAMEATLFSGWIYDTLKPFAAELQMGHPLMMKAIAASKKKNDKLDARRIADLVRCHLLPACYVAPPELRELRRLLRYRNLVVGQAVQMKNKMSGLLMEVGAEYSKQQLHGEKYFGELLDRLEEVPESVKDLLRLSRGVDVGAGTSPHPERSCRAPICQRSTGRSSPPRDCTRDLLRLASVFRASDSRQNNCINGS